MHAHMHRHTCGPLSPACDAFVCAEIAFSRPLLCFSLSLSACVVFVRARCVRPEACRAHGLWGVNDTERDPRAPLGASERVSFRHIALEASSMSGTCRGVGSHVRVGMLGRGVPPPPRSAHAASDAAAVGQSPRHHATPGLRAGLEGLERDLRRDGHIRHHRQREPALVPLLAPVRLGPHVCRGPASARDGPPCPDQSWGTSALTTHQVQAFPILAPDPCPPVRPSRLPAARSARPAQRSTVRPLTTPRRSPAARPALPAPAAPRPDPRTSAARAHLPPPSSPARVPSCRRASRARPPCLARRAPGRRCAVHQGVHELA